MVGPPKALASTTCRPRGPSVTRTASASLFTPASMPRRAVSSYSISLLIRLLQVGHNACRPGNHPCFHTGIAGAEHGCLLGNDSQHVACRQDQVLLAVVLDLGAAVLAVDDGVTLRDVDRDPLRAILVPPAGADCDDGALLGLLLGGVRNDQTGRGRGLGLVGLHENLVLEWLDLHLRHDWGPPLFGSGPGRSPGLELAVGPGVARTVHLPDDSASGRALEPSSRVPTQGIVRLPPSTLYTRVLALKTALLLPAYLCSELSPPGLLS